MASKTPRDERTQRWRGIPILMAVTFAASTLQLVWASASMAQVKAPSKNQLRAPEKTASTDNVQPFSISSDGLVVEQLISLRIDPADAAAASDAIRLQASTPQAINPRLKPPDFHGDIIDSGVTIRNCSMNWHVNERERT